MVFFSTKSRAEILCLLLMNENPSIEMSFVDYVAKLNKTTNDVQSYRRKSVEDCFYGQPHRGV